MNKSGYNDLEGGASGAVAQLRRFDGAPKEFWPLFLGLARQLAGANRATLGVRVRQVAPGPEGAVESWRALVSDPSGGARLPDAAILGLALAEGLASGEGVVVFAVGGEELGEGVVALELASERDAARLPTLIELLGSIVDSWQAERAVRGLRSRLDGLAGALDLGLVVAAQPKFKAAAFAACNELAARLQCDRVSLGWQDDAALRLQAISQADQFDARASIVRQVEAAMEETYDQDEILVFPSGAQSDQIVREHGAYAAEAKVNYLCSAPLRQARAPRGVWLLERAERPFSDEETALLRVMADQVGPRLADLREREGWWPKRLWRRLKAKAAEALGPQHTGPKLAGLAGALVVLFLVFGRLPYSVEAPATLRSKQVIFVTAPFDGFIDEVFYEVGDTVAAGAKLVTFDTREILVQQAAELANLNRFTKEAERARAQNALADMRVAEAQADQARAVLERTRFRLEQAVISAPLDGVVVEGDLRRRIGSPVRQGEVLAQQAQLGALYIQVEVAERDVHEIVGRNEARMLFASRPDETFPLAIERLQPAGIGTETGVVFQLRASSLGEAPEWWRPGMSGTVRIDAGWRNAGWIMTHRTGDWLRRQLWW